MSLHDVAPRLARARDQMNEVERVLGWMRDNDWAGEVKVLVPTAPTWPHWMKDSWTSIVNVAADSHVEVYAHSYGGNIPTTVGHIRSLEFWEISGIIITNYLSKTLPSPPVKHPWRDTTPPSSQGKVFFGVDWGAQDPTVLAYFHDGERFMFDGTRGLVGHRHPISTQPRFEDRVDPTPEVDRGPFFSEALKWWRDHDR